MYNMLSEKSLSHMTFANVLSIAIYFSFGYHMALCINYMNPWSFILNMNLDASNYLTFEALGMYFLTSLYPLYLIGWTLLLIHI